MVINIELNKYFSLLAANTTAAVEEYLHSFHTYATSLLTVTKLTHLQKVKNKYPILCTSCYQFIVEMIR